MFFYKVLLFLSTALAASAMATPRMQHVHRRHAVAARNVVDDQAPGVPQPAVNVVPRKRALRKRCRANPGSSSIVASTPAPSAPSAQPTAAPVNVGGNLPVFSSSSAAAPTHEPSPVASPPKQPAPKPSTVAPPPPPPPSAPAVPPAAPPSSGSGNPLLTQKHSGDATFYATGLGSCGITNTDTDFIAAVSHILYDGFPGYEGGNPNNNPICGRKATAHYQGKSVTITITDRCTACAEFDLDFSPSAFSQLADQSLGRLHGMTWTFD